MLSMKLAVAWFIFTRTQAVSPLVSLATKRSRVARSRQARVSAIDRLISCRATNALSRLKSGVAALTVATIVPIVSQAIKTIALLSQP